MILTCAGLFALRHHLTTLFLRNDERHDSAVLDVNAVDADRSSLPPNSPSEQCPIEIREFSSQYGSNRSDSYVAANLCSHPEIFPLYGDSTHALVFRTYGPWWMAMPSYQESIRHFTRWESQFTSRDFIEVEFKDSLDECISLDVYETYNPGTLEVVYVGQEHGDNQVTWHRVWSFPLPFRVVLSDAQEFLIEDGRQEMKDLFNDRLRTNAMGMPPLDVNRTHGRTPKFFTRHTHPAAARLPRIVKIPLEKKFSFPTRLIRLEFDHSTVDYYAEIDTVFLCGKRSSSSSTVLRSLEVDGSSSIITDDPLESHVNLSQLPFDILRIICSYLDLRSLVRLSSTCRTLHGHCLDPLQFQSLNLQPYWNGITNYAIEHFFLQHCGSIRHLSLSWTKSIHYSPFQHWLQMCSENLVQLNLACCQYLTGHFIKTIASSCPNLEIVNLENCISLNHLDFLPLKYLRRVRSLNVYRTKIDYRTLLPLIEANRKHLENINLGACQKLHDTIGIVRLLLSRCFNLRSLDLWRAQELTPNGFLSLVGLPFDLGEDKRRILNLATDEQEEFALIYSSVNMPIAIHSLGHLKYLREIDLGWTDPPPGFVRSFVQQIGHSLIKLFLTACRRVTNDDLMAVSEHCLELRQLDLLGSSVIHESTVECVLKSCVHMEFIDLSFCDKICDEKLSLWSSQYRICFKRSYSPRCNDDVREEFP